MNLRPLLPLFAVCATGLAQTAPRSRALGVPFDGTPGALDAITDVKGVEIGDTTLIRGEGKLVVGQGPVRNDRPSLGQKETTSLATSGRCGDTPGAEPTLVFMSLSFGLRFSH